MDTGEIGPDDQTMEKNKKKKLKKEDHRPQENFTHCW